jgi:hypothetical protein
MIDSPALERRPMNRFITRWCALGLMVCATAPPAFAQVGVRTPLQAMTHATFAPQGELRGTVEDEKGQPVQGAVVSALGATTLFALADADGRFVFRNLASGPYLVRVHLQGYTSPRARLIQVTSAQRSEYVLSLTRAVAADTPPILAAGLGGAPSAAEPAEPAEHDHDERAWRLRHAKRSILRDAEEAVAVTELKDESLFEDSFKNVGRAVGHSARLASSLFADLPLTGQINLLTTSAFERPQDLFALDASVPRAVAYMSLVAPRQDGQWSMRGTVTQGDLSSWVLSGAYRRAAEATHAYEAGVSYSTQQYLGGNTEALLAMADGGRNVGVMYAYDNWAVLPRIRLGYGAQYAKYGYLEEANLFSPRLSVTVQPRDAMRVRVLVSHREDAPGAREFMPSSTGLWLPPERTFSQISRDAFRPQRLDHYEVSAEHEWPAVVVGVRAFRQEVGDQVVTLFGLALADAPASLGHYYVGSAGAFSAQGWGVSVSRALFDGVRASLDYSEATTQWSDRSRDAVMLQAAAPTVMRSDERIHDLTASFDGVIGQSGTRLFVLYKVNSAFARDTASNSMATGRFNVQVNQSLPFMRLAHANWEMLAAVSNLFNEDLSDGSVYDEPFVVHPPKRILGGVTVRF